MREYFVVATELRSLGLKNCFREAISGICMAGLRGAALAVRIFTASVQLCPEAGHC